MDGDPTLWWKVGFKGRPNDRNHRKSHLLWAGVLCRVATHLARSASPDGPLWVTGGKTRSEYIFSEFPQVADIAGARSGSRLPPPKRNAAASTASTDQQAHETGKQQHSGTRGFAAPSTPANPPRRGSNRNSIRCLRRARPARAFITSQRQEGWVCMRAGYDDGVVNLADRGRLFPAPLANSSLTTRRPGSSTTAYPRLPSSPINVDLPPLEQPESTTNRSTLLLQCPTARECVRLNISSPIVP